MRSPNGRALLIFARDPSPGRVKTRLIPAFGAEGATRIYRKLLKRSLDAAIGASSERIELWTDRPPQDPELLQTIVESGLRQNTQTGNDLGARMLHALQTALASADRAVLIGSDCPSYTAGYLDAAFDALTTHDTVIGPAADGGYVLIGLKRTANELFEDISWSTEHVLATTRKRLTALNWRWHELEVLRDVDVPDDLAFYPDFTTGVPLEAQTKA